MRIGLYGLPCAGKSYLLERLDFIKVFHGSKRMKERYPDFDAFTNVQKEKARMEFAESLLVKDDFIMDGHYAFGKDVVFTAKDGELYDVFLYLYIEPAVLQKRMEVSSKNKKYAAENLAKWQKTEIDGLRTYCHLHDKDFFILDFLPTEEEETASAERKTGELGYSQDVSWDFEQASAERKIRKLEHPPYQMEHVIEFIWAVFSGFSCVNYARECVDVILKREVGNKKIVLSDGDKTITQEDTSRFFYDYKTFLFDHNFYSGYQTFWHYKNFAYNNMLQKNNMCEIDLQKLKWNQGVTDFIDSHTYILTTGDGFVWEKIAKQFGVLCFYGERMCADTKYFIAKFLRQAGKEIVAFGDSKNDFFMLQEADKGYLITKRDGTVSRSLRDMEFGKIVTLPVN